MVITCCSGITVPQSCDWELNIKNINNSTDRDWERERDRERERERGTHTHTHTHSHTHTHTYTASLQTKVCGLAHDTWVSACCLVSVATEHSYFKECKTGFQCVKLTTFINSESSTRFIYSDPKTKNKSPPFIPSRVRSYHLPYILHIWQIYDGGKKKKKKKINNLILKNTNHTTLSTFIMNVNGKPRQIFNNDTR